MTITPIRTSVVAPEIITEMCSYAVDAWFDDVTILTDEAALVAVMREAAEAGDATILGQTSVVFPNGALTAVLLLAQSHLSVHTWPELGLATFDLLTCGRLHGDRIVSHLQERLSPTRANVVRNIRDVR
jgi:S-adenosylmethionine decarboxylase